MINDTVIKVSDGSEMRSYVARPESVEGTIKNKAIIVLQEAFGVNEYIRRMADRFALQGYLAIAPELFHRTASGFEADYEKREGVAEAMGALTVEGQVADLQAAYDWLVKEMTSLDAPHSGASGERSALQNVVTIGFCMGGRAAYLANSSLPLAASVSFYGGGIAPTLLDRAGTLHGPQLFVWGGQDAHILPEHTRAVADALRGVGKSFVEATFSEAGHGFACDARSAYHAPSAREAFALADAFLAEGLV